MKNKRGWMKIVEAFISILLITGVVLIIVNKGYLNKTDISKRVFEIESSTLKEIERDDDLRKEILNADNDSISDNDVELESHLNDILEVGNSPKFPSIIWNKINEKILLKYSFLECYAKICELNKICALTKYPVKSKGKEIFSQSIAITTHSSSSGDINPKQLKLFCWEK